MHPRLHRLQPIQHPVEGRAFAAAGEDQAQRLHVHEEGLVAEGGGAEMVQDLAEAVGDGEQGGQLQAAGDVHDFARQAVGLLDPLGVERAPFGQLLQLRDPGRHEFERGARLGRERGFRARHGGLEGDAAGLLDEFRQAALYRAQDDGAHVRTFVGLRRASISDWDMFGMLGVPEFVLQVGLAPPEAADRRPHVLEAAVGADIAGALYERAVSRDTKTIRSSRTSGVSGLATM